MASTKRLALLGRNDPLINLALARYARNSETVKVLFDAGEPADAIQLAVLSNATVAKEFKIYSRFPVSVLGGEARGADWAVNASREELAALFLNPNLNDDFLRNVLSSKKPWDAIPDEQFMWIVTFLGRNERMSKHYVSTHYDDGYSSYTYDAVFDAAWGLAARLPTTTRWADALGWLFDCMVTEAHSIKSPLELALRWQTDPADAAAIEEETKSVKQGWLSGRQRVRKGLARLAEATEHSGGMVLLILKSLWRSIEGLITSGFVLYVFSRLESRQEFIFVSLFGIIYSWQRSIFQAEAYRVGRFVVGLDNDLSSYSERSRHAFRRVHG